MGVYGCLLMATGVMDVYRSYGCLWLTGNIWVFMGVYIFYGCLWVPGVYRL